MKRFRPDEPILHLMNEFEVTCITKPERENRHEHITHIGNTSAGWCMTRETAIKRIDSKQEAYYTMDTRTGKKAYLAVIRESGTVPYLRSHADGAWSDNLLAQPECAGCRIIT